MTVRIETERLNDENEGGLHRVMSIDQEEFPNPPPFASLIVRFLDFC